MQTHQDIWFSVNEELEHIYFRVNQDSNVNPYLDFIPWPIKVSAVIFSDGSKLTTASGGGGGGGPAGSTGEIQFNDNGSFGASGNFSIDPSSATLFWQGDSALFFATNMFGAGITLRSQNTNLLFESPNASVNTLAQAVRMFAANVSVGSGGFAPSTYRFDVSGDINITDPGGFNGYAFRVNGVPIGGGSPAGANTQIQYNNNGAFGASGNLIWDNSNLVLRVGEELGIYVDITSNFLPFPTIGWVVSGTLVGGMVFDGGGFDSGMSIKSQGALKLTNAQSDGGLGGRPISIRSGAGIFVSSVGNISIVTGGGPFASITISAGQSPLLLQSDSGNTGIGTFPFFGDPIYKLDVVGDINITDPGGANGFAFRINGVPFTGIPAGSDMEVQLNSNGAFGATPNLTYDPNWPALILTDQVFSGAGYFVVPPGQAPFAARTNYHAQGILIVNTGEYEIRTTAANGIALKTNDPSGSNDISLYCDTALHVGIGGFNSSFLPQFTLDVLGDVRVAGQLNLAGTPTSPAGLSPGDVWNNGGVLNIV